MPQSWRDLSDAQLMYDDNCLFLMTFLAFLRHKLHFYTVNYTQTTLFLMRSLF